MDITETIDNTIDRLLDEEWGSSHFEGHRREAVERILKARKFTPDDVPFGHQAGSGLRASAWLAPDKRRSVIIETGSCMGSFTIVRIRTLD